jgi:hypothetical protein
MILQFITLTTGNVKRYDRDDYPDSSITEIKTGFQTKTLWKGWSMNIRRSTPQQAVFDLSLDGVLVTHCWLCLTDAAANALWREAIQANAKVYKSLGAVQIKTMKQPTAPWLAVDIAIENIDNLGAIIRTRPERLLEAIEIELGIAWTLLT